MINQFEQKEHNSHNNVNICEKNYDKTVQNSWTTLSC